MPLLSFVTSIFEDLSGSVDKTPAGVIRERSRIALWLLLYDHSWSTGTPDLASGANMLSSPTSRAHSDDLVECSGKGCLVSEPGLVCDCNEWLSRLNEQLHREFDTPLNKPSVAGDSKACLE